MKLYFSESFGCIYTIFEDVIYVLDQNAIEWQWQQTQWVNIKDTTLNAKYIGTI